MFKNYFKIILRTIRRHKGYVFLNVVGLAIGLAVCLLIGIYVQEELSYDRFHENADRIYRLANYVEGASYENGIAKVTDPWGPAAVAEIPEVESMTRFVFYGQTLVRRGDQQFYESGGLYADSTVFEMFSFELLEGNPATVLDRPNTIVLTRELADRYFAGENPVGQVLRFDQSDAYEVTGVMADVPSNAHFRFPFLVSLNTYTHPDRGDWVRWNQFYTYLLLRDGADPEAVAGTFDTILDRHLDAERAEAYRPFLQPLTSIHLHSQLFREMSVNGSMSTIYIFSSIALFLLLIACINFINLATARATQRAREVGVRKVAGASRLALIQQFLSESFLLTLVALLLAIGFAELALPIFNEMLGQSLAVDFLNNPVLLWATIGLLVVVGLLTGGYPAFVLSSFKPVQVFKGMARLSGSPGLRKSLVVFQFSLSALLIIASGVVYNQLDYISGKNLGFDKTQIVNLPIRTQPVDVHRIETFKQTLLQHPGILHVSASANQPGGSDYGIPYEAEGVSDDQLPSMRILVVDHAFLDTYGMEVVQGRSFSRDFATDSAAYLINEAAAAALGWGADALNKRFSNRVVGRESGPIIGIVRDFHFRSLHDPIAPLLFMIEPSWASQFSVKLSTDDLEGTLAFLEEQWSVFEPEHPFTYTFFDQQFDQLHQAEESMGEMVGWLTLLVILVACMGLFGLSAFMTQQRTKEIGVRKVLGASVGGIVLLLSREFARLVLFGFLLAAPVAYLLMKRWLDDFAYRVDLGFGVFLLAGMLALVIGWLTVSYQSIKAARSNPVEALRYE